jgi:pimeloyl-ACP methyl ester carboxylesterase
MSSGSIYRSQAGEQAVNDLYDSVLATWPVAYDTHRLATRHGATFVIAGGDARRPPLVLIHGAGANSCIWAADFPVYTRTHRVFAVDLVGEPGRSAPNRPPWEGPAYAEWLEDILDAFGLRTAALVGISQGAWTALKFAVDQPTRVTKLGLLTPGGIVPDRLSFVAKAVPLTLLGRWGARRMSRLLYADQPIPAGVEEITMLIMRNFRPRIGVLPLFTDVELQRLTMPVLVMVGAKDALRDGAAIIERLQRHVPDLASQIVPGAGHALINTAPDVAAFLTGPADARPPAA